MINICRHNWEYLGLIQDSDRTYELYSCKNCKTEREMEI